METGTTGIDISGALTTAFNSVVTDTLEVISAILPVAISVVGAMLVISIGIKVFKRISGKA